MNRFFNRQEPIYALVVFRVVFGLCMLISTLRFLALGWVEKHYTEPKFHFKYYGFEWLTMPSEPILYGLHVLLAIASIAVIIGAFYRLASLLQFLIFSYLCLLDLTFYLNHYYFVALVSFLLIFLPANRFASVDVNRKPTLYSQTVPAWSINILKFQVFVVYFFAGLAKINSDWLLEALPLKIWLPSLSNWGEFMSWPITAYAFSWAGMLYDLLIVFFLLYRKTRAWAYVLVIVFHLSVGLLFQIGVFPLVMIATTLIFFSANWHKKLLSYFGFRPRAIQKRYKSPIKKWQLAMLGLYVGFQLLFPLRFLAYPGSLFWTEQGYRFSWRVMLMEKAGTATFFVDGKAVDNRQFLSRHQENQMATQPDMILQYAHFLADTYKKNDEKLPKITAEVYITLNSRPSKLYFSTDLNLTTLNDSFKHKNWINPW